MSTFAKALTYYLAVKGKTQQDLINDLHYSSTTAPLQFLNGVLGRTLLEWIGLRL